MLDRAIDALHQVAHPIVYTYHGCHYRWPGWIERMWYRDKHIKMSLGGLSPMDYTYGAQESHGVAA